MEGKRLGGGGTDSREKKWVIGHDSSVVCNEIILDVASGRIFYEITFKSWEGEAEKEKLATWQDAFFARV